MINAIQQEKAQASVVTDKLAIDWLRIIPFILIHLGCLLVFWVGFSFTALIVAGILYAVRIFSIGAFYHRYFSHKAFTTSRFCQFIFACLAMTSVQRGPLWWAAHHRDHHINSDTKNDPHSPYHQGFWGSHMGWFLSKKHYNYNPDRIKDFSKYPELVFIDKNDVLVPAILGFGLFILGTLLAKYCPDLKTNGMQLFVWGFCISTVLVYHVTFSINSIAHKIGRRPFDTKDQSRNNWLLAIFTFGEGWHNNHHRYPISARQGFKWWQVDITYYILKFMDKIGIISNLKVPPAKYL